MYDTWLCPWLTTIVPRKFRRVLGIPIFLNGYRRLFFKRGLALRRKLIMILRLLKVDVNVQHGHQACEMAEIALCLLLRKAEPGELMVEAG